MVIGVWTLYRVVKNWRALWDDEITEEDLRLARSAAFYLLIPPTVLLHELAHAIAIWAQGREVGGFLFLGYLGAVFVVPVGGIEDFVVALAGNATSLFIGVACLVIGLRRPGHPVRNILWIDLGRQTLFIVLLFYPLLSVGAGDGDFKMIYDFDQTPIASGITAALHGLMLALGYGVVWKRSWASRATLLCSKEARRLPELERRLALDPQDLMANRDLGLLYFLAGDPARAKPHLEKVMARGPTDAKLHLAFGTVLADLREDERARPELERAQSLLLRKEDRDLAELKLRELDDRRR